MALLVVIELAARYADMNVDARVLAVRYERLIPNAWDDSRITHLDAGNLGTILISTKLKLRHRALLFGIGPNPALVSLASD